MKFKGPYKSTSNRIPNYDYSNTGGYFVTICTKDKTHLLSKVKDSRIILSKQGIILEKVISELKLKFLDIEIDKFVIMPNHIHILIIIKNAKSHQGDMINHVSTCLFEVIRFLKAKSSFLIHKQKLPFSWQSNYYEHIIRNEKDLYRIQEYILQNPSRWCDDKYFSKLN